MMPTSSERQELAQQFADHVTRMQRCLCAAGRQIACDDVVQAWAEYSDCLCAGWLMPPDDDQQLLDILLKHLPLRTGSQRAAWASIIKDAGDSSGDGILEFPDALLAHMGWKVGDELTVERTDSGELILRRMEK